MNNSKYDYMAKKINDPERYRLLELGMKTIREAEKQHPLKVKQPESL